MKRVAPFVLVPLMAACVPPGAVPEPVSAPDPVSAPQQQAARPAPITTAPPRPAPPVTPSSTVIAAWADASLSPGRWSYQAARGASSRALFGPVAAPSFTIACEPGRLVSLVRGGAPAGTLTIRTSSTARTLSGALSADGLRAQLPANDPILDAIAFSRGRFAVEAPGVPALVIPAWPELARVVEDCRR